MTPLARNVLVSGLAGAWYVVATLVAVPLQLRLLGAEAVGILGLLAVLQVVFALLHLGLAPALIRRVAVDSPDRERTHALASSACAVTLALAAIAAAVLAATADHLSTRVLDVREIDAATVRTALGVIAIVLVVRTPTVVFGAVLSGLNRVDVLHLLRVCGETARLVGGVGAAWMTGQLLPVLIVELVVTALELVAHVVACRRFLPGLPVLPRLSLRSLREDGTFALGMGGVALAAVVMAYVDKLAIARWLSLDDLGLYHSAWRTTGWIAYVQLAFHATLLGALSTDVQDDALERLRSRTSKATRLISLAVAFPAIAFALVGRDLLSVVLGPGMGTTTGHVAGVLALGFLVNALVAPCLTLAAAAGRSRLALGASVVALAVDLAALALLLPRLGITGAAWAWLAANAVLGLVLVPVVHREVLRHGATSWIRDTAPFVAIAAAALALARVTVGSEASVGALLVAIALAAAAYGGLGLALLGRDLRAQVLAVPRALLRKRDRDVSR